MNSNFDGLTNGSPQPPTSHFKVTVRASAQPARADSLAELTLTTKDEASRPLMLGAIICTAPQIVLTVKQICRLAGLCGLQSIAIWE